MLGKEHAFAWNQQIFFVSHSVKSVLIQSFSGPYFPAFGLNSERCSVCGNIRTRKTPNTDTFHAVSSYSHWINPFNMFQVKSFPSRSFLEDSTSHSLPVWGKISWVRWKTNERTNKWKKPSKKKIKNKLKDRLQISLLIKRIEVNHFYAWID